MKRWVLVVACFLVFFARTAGASPAYGTKMPAKEQVFMGLQYYSLNHAALNNGLGSVHSRQNYFTLSYGLTDWLALDLKASLYSTFRHDPHAGRPMDYERPLWGGGYGLRIKAYESGPVKAVVGFQHFSIHPRTVKANGEKDNGILEDWQGSALVSYDLKHFTPYAGARYTLLDYIHRLNDQRKMIKADGNWRAGFVTGVDIPVSSKVWVNLEGAAGGGESVAASLNFHF